METIETVLRDVPLFEGLTPEQLELIAGCGSNVRFGEGELLFREGDEADTFYVVRHGSVALETFVPGARRRHDRDARGGRGGRLVVALPAVPLALRRARARARAGDGFDGACLRGKCEADPRLGYDADVALRAGADRAPAVDAAPAPRRLWRRRAD